MLQFGYDNDGNNSNLRTKDSLSKTDFPKGPQRLKRRTWLTKIILFILDFQERGTAS